MPRAQHHDAVGERVGFLEVMRRQDDCAAGGGEPTNLLPEPAA